MDSSIMYFYLFDVVSLFIKIPLQFTIQINLDSTKFKDGVETFHQY